LIRGLSQIEDFKYSCNPDVLTFNRFDQIQYEKILDEHDAVPEDIDIRTTVRVLTIHTGLCKAGQYKMARKQKISNVCN